MFEISETREMPAGAEQVWQMLAHFPGYDRWNPFVRIEGVAAARERVRYRFTRAPGKRAIVTDALISVCDRPLRLEFEVGVPGLIRATEFYELESAGTGIRLTHGMRFSGLLAVLGRSIGQRMDRAYFTRPLDRLALHLAESRNTRTETRGRARGKRPARRKGH